MTKAHRFSTIIAVYLYVFFILYLCRLAFGVDFNLQIMLMEKFKVLLDPKGILNPYKVLPNASKATSNPAAARTVEAAEVY